MPKLRFDNFMVSIEKPTKIWFVDKRYGFIHEISEYDTKLNLQEKTYEISEEQKWQMNLAELAIKHLETNALQNKDTVLYFKTITNRYITTNHPTKNNLLRIAVEGPHITLHGQPVLSTKEHTVTEITQAVYEYIKQGCVLTRIPLDKSSYWKEQTIHI